MGVSPDHLCSATAEVPEGEVLLTTIPDSAQPEHVLDQLATLR